MNYLISLAEKKFKGSLALLKSERKLLEKVYNAQKIQCQRDNNQSNGNSNNVKQNQIRATLIVWLCTEPKSRSLIKNQGLKIFRANILGELNFNFLTFDFPLYFQECTFEQGFFVQGAKLKSLDLSNSSINYSKVFDETTNGYNDVSLQANNVKIDGNILLTNFIAKGRVSFSNASIDGNVICYQAKFQSNNNYALDFCNARINGAIILEKGFKANGTVSLYGAEIKNLQCDGEFTASDINSGIALTADNARINGSVFLKENFKATGEVRFSRATMLSLECEGAKIESKNNLALIVDNSQINGFLLLRKGFEATGRVSLCGTKMDSLICDDGRFSNSKKLALIADNSKINGYVSLRKGFKADGEVSLYGANIGSLECDGGEFNNPENTALNAEGVQIKGSVLLGEGFKANGQVSFSGANIGSLECDGGEFNNPENTALNAEDTQIKGSVLLREGFKANGQVSFSGANMEFFSCSGGKFNNPENTALNAEGVQIKGSVLLREGFKANGEVSFYGANIRSLECDGGEFNNPENTALNVEEAQIKGSVLLREEFKADGKVSFLNSMINNVNCDGEFNNSKDKDKDFALNFQGSRIKGSVSLEAKFKGIGIVSFRDTNIEGTLRFLFDSSSLKEIKSLHHYILNLEFAKVNTLEDKEKSWPQKGNLQLDGFSYEKISINSPNDSEKRLKWLRLQKNKPFSPQPYEKLATILKASGKEKTATEILIGKQNDRRCYAELNFLYKCWSNFLRFTIDYGYRPYKALCFSALIISLGTIFFSCGYSGLKCENQTNERLMVQTREKQFQLSSESLQSQSSIISENYPTFNPLFYSLDVFLPIVDLSQQNYWLPNSNRGKNIKFLNIKTGVLLRWYYWFHIIAGWVFTTLSVTAFTGLIKNLN